MFASNRSSESHVAQVLIRDLPDDIVERLKDRARFRGESLEAHLRTVLEGSIKDDRDDFLRFARELRARSRDPQLTDSTAIIRGSRDSGYPR
jgi:plasmid stability protein